MNKAQGLRLKTREPECGARIEVELTDGTWERVRVAGSRRTGQGILAEITIQFDDESERTAYPDSLSWRWPSQ